MERCVLCGCEFEGYGNNPAPLAREGRCCDACNMQVVEARLKMLRDVKMMEILAHVIASKVCNEVITANEESGIEGVNAVLRKYELDDLIEEGEDE